MFFFFLFFFHESTCKTYCTAVDIFRRELIGTIISFLNGHLQRKLKKTNYIFIFAKKKKKRKEKNQLKKLFSGREFLLAACPRRHVFYPS